jgi:rRNA maturation endonuclease Nob1
MQEIIRPICYDCKQEIRKKDEARCPRCGEPVHRLCLHPSTETCWVCQEAVGDKARGTP